MKYMKIVLEHTGRTDLMCVYCGRFRTDFAITGGDMHEADAQVGVHKMCAEVLSGTREPSSLPEVLPSKKLTTAPTIGTSGAGNTEAVDAPEADGEEGGEGDGDVFEPAVRKRVDETAFPTAGRKNKCSVCDALGHNKATCKKRRAA